MGERAWVEASGFGAAAERISQRTTPVYLGERASSDRPHENDCRWLLFEIPEDRLSHARKGIIVPRIG